MSCHWTPEQRARQAEATRRRWAAGEFNMPRRCRPDHWTPEQESWLRDLAGTVPWGELEGVWYDRTGLPRTLYALKKRACLLGISLRLRSISLRGLERLFGVSHQAILKHWVGPGLLRGARYQGRGPWPQWWFTEAAVEAFIRNYPWLFDPAAMQPGQRLSQTAQLLQRSDPWRSYAELASYVGISQGNLDLWRERGLVPCKTRPKSGRGDRILVRGRDFAAIRQAVHAAQADARLRANQATSRRRRREARAARAAA